MLVKAIITRVRNIVGDINAIQFSDQMVVDWINDGVKEVAVSNSLLQKSATSNTVANQADYTLPPDIFKLYSVVVDNEKIRVFSLQEWEELNSGDGSGPSGPGRPQTGYIWGTTLTLTPAPDRIYSLKINYIYEAAELSLADAGWEATLTPGIPTSYHLRLVTYCLAQIALQDEDFAKYQSLMQQFASGVLDLKHQGETEEDLYPFISVSSRDMGDAGGWY